MTFGVVCLAIAEIVGAVQAFVPPPRCPNAPITRMRGGSDEDIPKNSALVFVKPHAVTTPTIELVRSELEKAGILVLEEGDIASETIDEKKLVDQHYYAIASKATITPPAELAVPEDKFKDFFGEDWATVLADDRAKTAIDASKALGLDGAAMDAAWGEAKAAGNIIKLGGGFYCGLLGEGDDALYTFNAFYMSMRDRFTAPGGSIHYFVVEWDAETLPWSSFRGSLLGPTDPASAPPDSIRGQIFANWQDLGLAAEPNTGDNGVHASASPLEGLAEKMNWLEIDPADDPFGAYILNAGLGEATLRQWVLDPVLTLEDGSRGSLFDALEDKDASPCAAKIAALVKQQDLAPV
ncbi:hypothetical protein CTAYLR_009116 [Chrysophaeum taylorii]|uniref:Nucleoside-diphosphate kinase n=1 Tax=Chrysophaeum taylorii TaxID=2483200 RepID=A0AAD7UJN2_9STRA|nr:hypothetical protein CTAYLR_009116 [Chrysophaeum taylorii]